MRIFTKLFLVVTCIATLAVFSGSAQAAPPAATTTTAALKVNVAIPDGATFWNFSFLTTEGILAKPAQVKVLWSTGDVPKSEKAEIACTSGKETGLVTIQTEKGLPINLSVQVVDAKGRKLGAINLQVINKGQTENVDIATPEVVEPTFTWGNS